MKIHHLKCIPPYFEDVYLGNKLFELRRDDRDFQVSDILHLKEYIPNEGFTGRSGWYLINYKLKGFEGLSPEYCILGISFLPRKMFNQLLADAHQNLRNGK